MEKTKTQTVIWSWYPNDELDVSEQIGFDLFPNCVIKKEYYDSSKANENDFNVIIVNYFFSKTDTRPQEDLSWADLVIHYTTEILIGPWEYYEQTVVKHFNNKNFVSLCNGISQMDDYPSDRVYVDSQTFFTRIAHYCRPMQITKSSTSSKDKLFDALLGKDDGRRPKVFEMLKENDLLDKSFVNLYNSDRVDDVETIYRSPDLNHYEDKRLIGIRHRSAKFLEKLENGKSMSHSIPELIYANSWYSLVAETSSGDHFITNSGTTFITEKITKCLLAGRIFVLFGDKGILTKLKEYGYKTFDAIVDESYDLEPNNDVRFSMAFEQVKKLANMHDHNEIYNKMYETLLHNQELLLDHKRRLKGIRDFLSPHMW
jgi:hypothetical protein